MKKTVIALALAAGLTFFVGPVKAENLFVSNYGANTISKITASGSVSTFSSSPLLNQPYGMAFNASGDLFVANLGADNILKLTLDGTASVFSSDPLLAGPAGVVFDASGDLLVANANLTTISKITPGGAVSTFATSSLLNVPSGLVIQRVPEPATCASLLAGIACGGYLRFRRRKQA